MAQQKISTPSVVEIRDEVILSTNAYGTPAPHLGIVAGDPWDTVLTQIDQFALDPSTLVAAMDNAELPSASNPFVTRSFLENRLGIRNFVLIGPPGSGADYEGTTDAVFTTALADPKPVIMVLPGIYLFSNPIGVAAGKRIEGVHPLVVQIQSTTDAPAFVLLGDSAELKGITITAPALALSPAVAMQGQRTTVRYCVFVNFTFLALQVIGARASVVNCYFNGNSAAAIFLQGHQQRVLTSVFAGQLTDGALRIESNEGGAHSCYFASTLTGFSYLIPSPIIHDVRMVGNNFESAISLSASQDLGTGTVRYANTPNNYNANVNNFLVPLAQYTGQPTIATNTVVDSQQFTYGPVASTDLTVITGAIDYALQNRYEERNWFLTSADPTFDSNGSPLSGVFSWDGNTRTLSWPNFELRSSMHRTGKWTMAAGSAVIQPGELLYIEVDRSLAGVDIALVPIVGTRPLTLQYPADAQRFILAVGLPTVYALWTSGFRLLSELTSFDVDGWPLPLTRFIGVSETRNPAPPYSGFSGPAQSSLVVKDGAQSAHVKLLYERSNLEYDPSSSDAMWTSDPAPGDWLTSAVLQNGLPSTPTHVLQLAGTAVALIPASGIYRFFRDSGGWSLIPGNPTAGPFAAMARLGTGVAAIVAATGVIVHWEPSTMTWASYTPTVGTSITLPLSTTVPVLSTFYTAGVADFSLQTDTDTIFTSVDGQSLTFSYTQNTLHALSHGSRVFGLDPESKSLISHGLKDSGFSSLVSPKFPWTHTGGTGTRGTSYRGLPLSDTSVALSILRDANFSSLATLDWATLEVIQFRINDSLAYMIVARDGSGNYYFFNGGPGTANFLGRWLAGGTELTFLRPDTWLLDIGLQRMAALGPTPAGELAMVVGSFATPATWTWTTQTIGTAGTCAGVIGFIDNLTLDKVVLVSNPARGNRPTWWRQDHATLNWTENTLTDSLSVVGDVLIPAAVANSFQYAGTGTDPTYGVGLSSPYSLSFMVRDNARGGRPTLFRYNRSTTTFTGIRLAEALGDVTLAEADTSSYSFGLGAAYYPPFETLQFVLKPSTVGQIRVFSYFETSNTWAGSSIGTGGTYLNTTSLGSYTFNNRTASRAAMYLATNTLHIWTPSGLLRGTFTGSIIGPFATQTWALISQKIPTASSAFPCFSASGDNSQVYSVRMGVDRAGHPSYQISSAVNTAAPLLAAASTENNISATGSIAWADTGVKVKQHSARLWTGLNRTGNGYLWIANSALSNAMVELTPSIATVRGDLVVTGLGSTTDYNAAITSNGATLGIVFRDAGNLQRLAFISYDVATGAVTLERSGFAPFVTSAVIPLASTPQISYNSFLNTWDIVAQDDSRSGGQLVFYRRPVGSSGWTAERVGAGGDKPLASMIAQAGRSPGRALPLANGDILVANENTASRNLLLVQRIESTGTWTTIFQTGSGGGFATPEIAASLDGLRYYIFGGRDPSNLAAVASSTAALSGWAVLSGLPAVYSRVQKAALLPYATGVLVASSLALDGVVPANRELGIFSFRNTNPTAPFVNGWTAKGRVSNTSTLASGEEEDSITDVSFSGTATGTLWYGALRPGRTALHWTARTISPTAAQPMGDSLAGPGRSITIGASLFRNQWSGDATESAVFEHISYGVAAPRNWTGYLPLAQRTGADDYLCLRWPSAADGASAFFYHGSPANTFTLEAALASGSWPTASSSRLWPRITGSGTFLSGASPQGSAVLAPGALLQFEPPCGVLLSTYMAGVLSIGPSGPQLRLASIPTLTLRGTHTFRAPSDVARLVTIVGPISYQLDPDVNSGRHLVLNFAVPGSLVLDTTANPLSYWAALDASVVNYPLVLGELREEEFFFYAIMAVGGQRPALTHGHLEPRELSSIPTARYQREVSSGIREIFGGLVSPPVSFIYDVTPISASTAALKEVGTGAGIQIVPSPQVAGSPWTLYLKRNLQVAGGSYVASLAGSFSTREGSGSTIALSPDGTFFGS